MNESEYTGDIISTQYIKNLIRGSLDTFGGSLAIFGGSRIIYDARDYLIGEIGKQRFNSERAIEVFTIAVDNCVWEMLKGTPTARTRYQDYKTSGLGKVYGLELAQAFKAENGVNDQRPPRRFLRGLLGA